MSDSSEIRCPACNEWFIPRQRRKYCSSKCSKAMVTARASCLSRLNSVERSIDHVCNFCNDPLGPLPTIGYKHLPGRRQSHPECKESHYYEVVANCPECSSDIRRKDNGLCGACESRARRRSARESGDRQQCAARFMGDDGSWVACDKDAYPLKKHCSKHEGDLRRHGEFRDWIWEWDNVSHLISQSDISRWRDRLLAQQRGRCGMFELCGKDESNNDTWHLDHDHSCDRHSSKRMCPKCVRGVLCWFCNVAVLGALEKDDMSPLDAARAIMHYLESGDQLKLAV